MFQVGGKYAKTSPFIKGGSIRGRTGLSVVCRVINESAYKNVASASVQRRGPDAISESSLASKVKNPESSSNNRERTDSEIVWNQRWCKLLYPTRQCLWRYHFPESKFKRLRGADWRFLCHAILLICKLVLNFFHALWAGTGSKWQSFLFHKQILHLHFLI